MNIIQKNVLTQEELDYVNNKILDPQARFPFYIRRYFVGGPNSKESTPWFGHFIIPREGESCTIPPKPENIKVVSPVVYEFFMPIVERFLESNNLKIKLLYRMSLNLMVGNCDNKYFFAPHKDHEYEHKVIIMYLNESSGDTVLIGENSQEIESVSPEAGKVYLFDGTEYNHTVKPPQGNDQRLILVVTLLLE